jgi:glycosyltransferase involved in cell wall biosynthesis
VRPLVVHFVRPAAAGMRRHVEMLLPLLATRYRVAVAGAADPRWAEALSRAGVPVEPLPWARPWRLAAVLRRMRPAAVHAHGYAAAAVAAAAGARPLVVTAHNLPGPLVVPRWGALWLAASHAVADGLVRRGVPARPVRVLPPACRLVSAKPADAGRRQARARWGLPPEAPVVGFLGRLTREKGVDVLEAAFRQLRRRHPDIRLAVWGEGPLRRRLGRVPGSLLGGPTDDVASALAAVDVVAVPSRREGLGLAALEALALGRPVVASAVGGLPEVVRHGAWGWLVPPGDPGALARALADLLGDAAVRRRMGEAGRAFAAGFPAEGLAAAVVRAYRDLLG